MFAKRLLVASSSSQDTRNMLRHLHPKLRGQLAPGLQIAVLEAHGLNTLCEVLQTALLLKTSSQHTELDPT